MLVKYYHNIIIYLLIMIFATRAQAAQGEGPPGQADPTKFSGKKSKAVAKQGAGNTQWAILKLSGIPEAEIPSFRCAPVLALHAAGRLRIKPCMQRRH